MASSNWDRLYKMPFAKGYAGLVGKAERKGRSKAKRCPDLAHARSG